MSQQSLFNYTIEFLNYAIDNRGIVDIEKFLLRHSPRFITKKYREEHLTTSKQRVKMMHFLFDCIINLSDRVSFQYYKNYSQLKKDHIKSCFIEDESQFSINAFSSFFIKHRHIHSLIEVRDFYIFMQELSSKDIFFSFNKKYDPLRMELEMVHIPSDFNRRISKFCELFEIENDTTISQFYIDKFDSMTDSYVIKNWSLQAAKLSRCKPVGVDVLPKTISA